MKVINMKPEMAKIGTLSPELMTSASFMNHVRFRPITRTEEAESEDALGVDEELE